MKWNSPCRSAIHRRPWLHHLQDRELIESLSLNYDAVQLLLDEHMHKDVDHGQRLFALLTLAMWARGEAAGYRG